MLKLNQNSLFAILLRSPWWVSALAALAVFGVVRLFLEWGFALFAAAPFIGIGAYGAWRELRRPGAKRIAATLDRARAMPWEEFCAALEAAYRREGNGVTRVGDELHLTRGGRVTLVTCKRWKAVRTGVEPLREFDAATRGRGAHGRTYIAAGEVTENARVFAAERNIQLVQEAELAELLK